MNEFIKNIGAQMKLYKYFIIHFVLIILFTSSLYAQSTDKLNTVEYNILKESPTRNGAKNSKHHINLKSYSYLVQQPNILAKLNSQSVLDSAVAVSTSEEKEKVILSHNEMGMVTHELAQESNGNSWRNYSQQMYSYDENGNVLTYQLDYWENSEWVPSRRTTSEFGEDGKMTNSIVERFDGEWENSTRNIWEYDEKGNNYIWLLDSWEDNMWKNSSKYDKTFDSNRLNIFRTYSYWENNTWEAQNTVMYEYDSNGREILYQYQSLEDNPWFNDYRYKTGYNSNGKEITLLYEEQVDNAWEQNRLESTSYDSEDKISLVMTQNWDGSQWLDESRESYDHSVSGSITFFSKDWDGSKWIASDSFLSYEDIYGNSAFLYGSIIALYFSTITDVESEQTIINEFELSQNYPNPFNPRTTIKYSVPNVAADFSQRISLKIYDVLGKDVKTLVNKQQSAGDYEVSFNGKNIPSGIYYYTLQTGEFSVTKKMVLLK